MIECHIPAQTRTPFPASRDFPSRGNKKIGGTGYCVTYDTDSQSRNVLASPLGEEGHEVAKGCTRVRMIMILDVDVTAERRHYNTHRPLKGKRLTTFCASLRSGGRRLAVRKMIECHIPAQTRTPFPASRDFPSRGNEKIGGTGYCVTYDTDSQSRNVLASPLGEEGHEVAKGCTRVRMIMILDVDVTAERRHYNTHRPKGETTTLGPKGPSNLRTLRPERAGQS